MTLFFFLLTTVFTANASNDKLSLEQFLNSVKSENQGYKASSSGEEAAKLYGAEAQIVYAPSLFSGAHYNDDAKHNPMPLFQYDKIISETYQLGIQQQTPIGLQGKFYYTLMKTQYKGLTPTNPAPFADARPTLELSQSLWRNDFGRETRAMVEAVKASAKADQHEEEFNKKNQLVQAEIVYWRLALARQNEDLARENLARAQKIYEWARRRVRLSLADRSDLLQATSVWQQRKLQLKKAQDDLRTVALAFNSARGQSGAEVLERLDPISKQMIDRLKLAPRTGERPDVLSAQQRTEALKARATMNREKNQPNLEIYGAYSLNTREPTPHEAVSESWNAERPSQTLGVRFSSSLAFGKMNDAQDGYALQIKSAELRLARQRFLAEQDWQNLVLSFEEAKERLTAAEELEAGQRAKLDHERRRQLNGRSTLFQVLTYENDYSDAQSIRLATLAELLQIAAQMKLYGVN